MVLWSSGQLIAGAVGTGAADVVVDVGLSSGPADVPDGVSVDREDELVCVEVKDSGSTVVVAV